MVGFQSIELIPCHLISSIRYTDIRVHQWMARQYKHVGEQRALKSQRIAASHLLLADCVLSKQCIYIYTNNGEMVTNPC